MSDAVVEHNYAILCELYSVYSAIVSKMYSNTDVYMNSSHNIDELLRQIESRPITWKYYVQQPIKFSRDFEDLIIFIDDAYINKNG